MREKIKAALSHAEHKIKHKVSNVVHPKDHQQHQKGNHHSFFQSQQQPHRYKVHTLSDLNQNQNQCGRSAMSMMAVPMPCCC